MWMQKNQHFVQDFPQFWHFRHVIKQVGMSQSATPATKRHDDLLGNLRKGEVLQLPHRHGDATGKSETRDKTRRNIKTSISYETSSNFHSVKQTECFPASPIDTAKPQKNQWPETRHVGTPKRAFRARLPPIFTLCSFKIDVFLRVFVGTSKFGNLKIDVSCEASVNFQHMSQNATPATESATWRHLTQPCQCDLQKTRDTKRLKCCACQAEWRWTRPKCCACHENCNASSENVAKVLCLPHQTTFDTLQKTRLNVTKCHACRAKRSNETLETSKNATSCRTYHRHGHTVLTRTVADGCERERNVQRTHPQPPDPQSETGTLATHSGKTQIFHQMTKKMTNKMTILQVWKIAFFSKHCHFFSVSFIFRQIFDIFPFFLRQWHQNDQKKLQIFHQMTKKDKTNDNCAGCKNCIFLEALSSLSFFKQLTIFSIFLKNGTNMTKHVKQNPPNDHKKTKIAFFWKHCHFFVIFCHFSNNFRYVSMFLRKWHQNDQNMTKFPPNDKKWQKMTGQNWNKKHYKNMTKKWQTKLKWQKKTKQMTKQMTDKTEMTKKWKKSTNNDKINVWTISRVWLRVASNSKL